MENSRFKFRVWITAPITQDVEEEKEVSFYIYDIALYNDGGVGFSRESLLEALDKLNLTEGQRNEIEDYISDNSYSEDWEWYAISFDSVEQCTGLKDRNGTLIYAGDILGNKDFMSDVALLKYNNEKCCYILERQSVDECFNKWWADRLMVIGNIHKNKELLK